MSENTEQKTAEKEEKTEKTEQPPETAPAEKPVKELNSDLEAIDLDDFPEPDYNAEPAVEFNNVVKSYYLYKSDKARFKAMFTGNKGIEQHSALNGVNFTIYPGESVGFVGRNGAGKSTILKLITGVSFPTSGDITVRGKVAALLELTAGFSPEMTGRENIYMKGLLLGLSEQDIAEVEDDIIEFSELDEYIDQPVRTYSSGMKMRLGFAINISIKPEVLVIDEALSVGDARFKKKCRAAIKDLIRSGVTVLFVSHSTDALTTTCNRAIYLKGGKVEYDGTVLDALEMYNKDVEEIRRKKREKNLKNKRIAEARLEQLRQIRDKKLAAEAEKNENPQDDTEKKAENAENSENS
ncbi:ABC-type polysaccharide/polyol phosphate transport system, ATPase component [Ruminococcus sp. YE71]|uniref:ABC transporter ATP-binding protein n=1 Tax=unclassified Ruminococcus TaxID=2608920 RepID=UPI00088CBC92|nr:MULTISPECIES: ABC transporter ATP-binding protein [unclassified Ruminococcus]SDA21636.1 ABC-type polysaccharide/polyol phosphate transport system, ATPase component [Ruminococcus sp. YE78]SFW36569.1 ABC-type polysaccharide/polyol phosphate transport system, ATPase component [Ruminococcus sp. YE71]